MVKIVNLEPHPTVVKEIVCPNCGATLSYVPQDVQKRSYVDYGGDSDTSYWIVCPNCDHKISVRP